VPVPDRAMSMVQLVVSELVTKAHLLIVSE
jgi:hypothetical protein